MLESSASGREWRIFIARLSQSEIILRIAEVTDKKSLLPRL